MRERENEKGNDQTVTHCFGQLLVLEYLWMDEGVLVRETSIGQRYAVCICVCVCVVMVKDNSLI